MEQIKAGVVKVLSEVLNIPPQKLADTNNFTEFENWDSLYHLNIVLGIEKEFGIHFDIQEVMLINSIDAAVDLIKKKSNSQK